VKPGKKNELDPSISNKDIDDTYELDNRPNDF
jgi:hypothetical protein